MRFEQLLVHNFGSGFSVAFWGKTIGGNAFGGEIAHHTFGAALRKLQVVGICTAIVGVSCQLDGDVRIFFEQIGQTVEGGRRFGGDFGAVEGIKYIAHEYRNVHRGERKLQHVLMCLVDGVCVQAVGGIEIAAARSEKNVVHSRGNSLLEGAIRLDGEFEICAVAADHLHLGSREFVAVLLVHPTFDGK